MSRKQHRYFDATGKAASAAHTFDDKWNDFFLTYYNTSNDGEFKEPSFDEIDKPRNQFNHLFAALEKVVNEYDLYMEFETRLEP